MSAVRYSAPGISGAVSTRKPSSASSGGRTSSGAAPILGAGGLDAERQDVTGGEVAPPDEDRRQGLADLAGAEAQQALSAALGEGLLETGGDHLVHARGVGDWLADQAALGREAEAERHHGGGTVSRKAASAQGAGSQDRPFAKIRHAFKPFDAELASRSGSTTSAAPLPEFARPGGGVLKGSPRPDPQPGFGLWQAMCGLLKERPKTSVS